MVSASLAVQVLGALTATSTEAAHPLSSGDRHLQRHRDCRHASSLPASRPLAMFWAAVLVIGFLWMFIVPYQIRLAVAADSSRSTALLVPAAQLLGAAFGPLAASLFIVADAVKAVPYFGIGARSPAWCCSALFLAVSRGRAVAA